jgi:RHH-type proline utilization regulon transcriptional repressor/proline dehydrogenase/delta 1-pyrroline-5-carboxylate dehydrogenase
LDVQQEIALADNWLAPGVAFDVALHQGSSRDLLANAELLAKRDGPIVTLRCFASESEVAPLEALVIERVISTNTAAAGGNASLMTIS